MKLVVQIPCLNEEATLPRLLAELPREADGFDEVEWLVIDDGSTDRSVEVACADRGSYEGGGAEQRGPTRERVRKQEEQVVTRDRGVWPISDGPRWRIADQRIREREVSSSGQNWFDWK